MYDQTNQLERKPYTQPALTEIKLDTEQVSVLGGSTSSDPDVTCTDAIGLEWFDNE